MTFDLGRVTTVRCIQYMVLYYCGDVRSRTSYNFDNEFIAICFKIAVTFDLGRVTTIDVVVEFFEVQLR